MEVLQNFVHGGGYNYVHGRNQFNDIHYAGDGLFFRKRNYTRGGLFHRRETMLVMGFLDKLRVSYAKRRKPNRAELFY